MDEPTAPRSDDESPSEDVLRRLRVPFIRRAAVAWEGQQRDVFAIDLAVDGVYLEWPNPPAVGTAVEVTFRLPDNEIPIAAACRVAWCHQPEPGAQRRPLPAGAGLTFVSVAADGAARVRGFVVDYYRRDPRSRRFSPHGAPREGGS